MDQGVAALLGALVGALGTWGGSFFTARSSERIHKKQARRQAYAGFLADMHALRRHLATCTESIIVRGPAGVAAQGSAMLDRLSDVGTLFDSLDQHLVTVALEGPERFVIDTTLAMAHAMALKDQLYEWLIDVQRAQLSPAETQVANQMLTDLDTAVSAVQREARRHV